MKSINSSFISKPGTYSFLALFFLLIVSVSAEQFTYNNQDTASFSYYNVNQTIIYQNVSGSAFNATYNNLLGQNAPSANMCVNGTYTNGTFIYTTVSTSGGSSGQNTTNIVLINFSSTINGNITILQDLNNGNFIDNYLLNGNFDVNLKNWSGGGITQRVYTNDTTNHLMNSWATSALDGGNTNNARAWGLTNATQSGFYKVEFDLDNVTVNSANYIQISNDTNNGAGTTCDGIMILNESKHYSGIFNCKSGLAPRYVVLSTFVYNSGYKIDNITLKLYNGTNNYFIWKKAFIESLFAGDINVTNIFVDGYRPITEGNIANQHVAYADNATVATNAIHADNATVATNAYLSDFSTGNSYKVMSDYNACNDNVNLGAETECYATNIISSAGDTYEFEYAGITQTYGQNNIFYINYYANGGGLTHQVTMPSFYGGGSGNDLWKITGHIIDIGSGYFQIVATLQYTGGDYNSPQVVYTSYLANTGIGGNNVYTGTQNNYLSLSFEDDSGAGYISTVYGVVNKL